MSLARWMEVDRLEEFARLDAPAQRLDARAKVAVTLLFVVAVMSFPRYRLAALMPFFLFPFAMLSLGRVPAGYLARRLLVAAPFAFAVAAFNPLLDREPLAQVGPVAVSGGWISFVSILMRFLLTVSAALALVACTGMHRLCAGLERLGMPRVFAVQLLFLHRYLFVVAEEGGRMTRGIAVRGGRTGALPFRLVGALLGHLLLRALARADRVYLAMTARGFDGTVRTLDSMAWRRADTLFVVSWAAFFVAARRWNLSELLGSMLAGGAR